MRTQQIQLRKVHTIQIIKQINKVRSGWGKGLFERIKYLLQAMKPGPLFPDYQCLFVSREETAPQIVKRAFESLNFFSV